MTSSVSGLNLAAAWTAASSAAANGTNQGAGGSEAALSGASSGFDSDSSPPSSVTSSSAGGIRPPPSTLSHAVRDGRHLGARPKGRVTPAMAVLPPPPMDRRSDLRDRLSPPLPPPRMEEDPGRRLEDSRTVLTAEVGTSEADQLCNQSGMGKLHNQPAIVLVV